MNNTLSFKKISKTGSLDSDLILQQYKFDLMARFMEIKSMNPKLTQKEIVKELGYSTFSSQRYRHDIKMLSLCRTPINSHKRRQKSSNRENDLERPQMTSNDLKSPQLTSKDSSPIIETVKPKKNKLMGGGTIEPNE